MNCTEAFMLLYEHGNEPSRNSREIDRNAMYSGQDSGVPILHSSSDLHGCCTVLLLYSHPIASSSSSSSLSYPRHPSHVHLR